MRIKIIKFLSGIFIAIVFLVGAAVIIVPYIVSTDAIRIRLAQDLSVWTGYSVQLRDLPKLKIFPYPKAFLSGVTLTPKMESAASLAAPLMEVESIEVDLSLVSLLWGRISFSETRIMYPKFIMDKPAKTISDFFDTLLRSQGAFGLAIQSAREIIKRNPDNPDVASLLNQPFGRIVIENGTLMYRDDASVVMEQITGLNASIDWPGLTQAMQFRAKARWHGELTELFINADQALLLLAGGKSSLQVSFNSVRGGITFKGQARLSEYYIFDGKVSLRSPGWDQTVAWIGGNQLWGHGLKMPIVWESDFLAQPAHVRMSNVIFTMGTANARGALEFDFKNHVPVLMGSLGFDKLDFDILKLLLFCSEQKNEFFDVAFLNRIGLDIRLSAPQAKIGGIALTDLAAVIQIKNGHGIFDLGNVNIFGGSIQSNIQIIPDGKRANIKGSATGTSVDAHAISLALGLFPLLQAKTNFIMTMQMFPGCWPKILTQMQGQLTLNMFSGQVIGHNLNDLQNKLSKNEQFLLTYDQKHSIDFDRLDIKAKLLDGTISVTEALMHTKDWNLFIHRAIETFDTKNGQNDLILRAKLQKNNRSETICKDIECLNNSLVQPLIFSFSPTEKIFGNFFVKKNIHEN
ncbi:MULTISPECIES: AsmA family protein [unclassified Bartonella]|uniref:AsmA family protein n=1 Tax=Bartonella TaxID=773 RepID=UPI00099B01D0|nr:MULTISPECIES: AsmA family protein [unclassified Bartonella]AQX22472.1 AsmA protein [Bartonella sp. 11B]AQX24246.1 AsmA protein [Bartonella sp. 114]AQX24920.1 AsmA protein [Bartonella sp. Coyote22sub2]